MKDDAAKLREEAHENGSNPDWDDAIYRAFLAGALWHANKREEVHG